MKIKKSGYPKTLSGSMTLSEDKSMDLPEIEVFYSTSVKAKQERKIDSVSIRFPSRADSKAKQIPFDNGRIIVEYNKDNELYSITFYSVESMIDDRTGFPKDTSPLEEYAAKETDIEVIIFIQIALQVWGGLCDVMPMIDMCGNLVKVTLDTSEMEEEAPDLDMDTPPDEGPGPDNPPTS